MKKIMGTTAILLFTLAIAAQPVKQTFKGIITDARTNEPLAGAIVVAGNALNVKVAQSISAHYVFAQ